MLVSFNIRRVFNKLSLRLHVDRENQEATLTVTYDRRLLRVSEKVDYHEVVSPEDAERWLSRPAGERGNFIEALEWQCRTGLLKPQEEAEGVEQ